MKINQQITRRYVYTVNYLINENSFCSVSFITLDVLTGIMNLITDIMNWLTDIMNRLADIMNVLTEIMNLFKLELLLVRTA